MSGDKVSGFAPVGALASPTLSGFRSGLTPVAATFKVGGKTGGGTISRGPRS